MKKIYSTPVIEIEKFDVVDVITDSTPDQPTKTYNEITGATGSYAVEVKVAW